MRNRFFGALAGLSIAYAVPAVVSAEQSSGALDGLVFVSTIEVLGTDRVFPDRKTFADGTFFSEECQRACDFGAWEYQTRIENDGAISFVADMSCSEAPQSVR